MRPRVALGKERDLVSEAVLLEEDSRVNEVIHMNVLAISTYSTEEPIVVEVAGAYKANASQIGETRFWGRSNPASSLPRVRGKQITMPRSVRLSHCDRNARSSLLDVEPRVLKSHGDFSL